MQHEAWLEGPLENVAQWLQPAAHALIEARRDVKACADLTVEQLWQRPNGAPSIRFHLLHIAGSLNRLLTYARGEALTERQFEFLKAETEIDRTVTASVQLTEKVAAEIETALRTIRETPVETLFEARFVGRQKLPTNVFGLLFHIAEHTQRHVGAVVTLAKIVRI